MTRAEVAESLGLTANSYGNYEYFRAPIRYDLACKLFARFDLSPMWLANGSGAEDVRVQVPAARTIGVSPRDLFSEVYDKYLSESIPFLVDAALAKQAYGRFTFRLSKRKPLTPDLRVTYEGVFFLKVRKILGEVPDDRFVSFLNDLLAFADDLAAQYPRESPEVINIRAAQLKAARKAEQ